MLSEWPAQIRVSLGKDSWLWLISSALQQRVKNNGSIALALGNCIGVHYPSCNWAEEAGAVATFDKASSTSGTN